MHPSLILHPGALLSLPELSAARLDGLLMEVGDGYMPADIPEDAAARLTSLAPLLAPGYAASGATAAWVHGVGDAPPSCHHLQRVAERRTRIRPVPNVIVHERRLPAEDVEAIAGLPVTTRVRTLGDLVLATRTSSGSSPWLLGLARAEPALVRVVRRRFESRRRMPGKRAAIATLDELDAYVGAERQDEVTR